MACRQVNMLKQKETRISRVHTYLKVFFRNFATEFIETNTYKLKQFAKYEKIPYYTYGIDCYIDHIGTKVPPT